MAFALRGWQQGRCARSYNGWLAGARSYCGHCACRTVDPRLIGTGKESDNAKQSTIDFSNSIVASTGLVGNYTRAIEQLSQGDTRADQYAGAARRQHTCLRAECGLTTSITVGAVRRADCKIKRGQPDHRFFSMPIRTPFSLRSSKKSERAIAANLRDAQKALPRPKPQSKRAKQMRRPIQRARSLRRLREIARVFGAAPIHPWARSSPLQDANQSMLISEADFRREMEGLKRRKRRFVK